MEFSQISVLLVVAAIAGIIVRNLKQPLLIGYLFAGFVLATFGLVTDIEVFSGLGQIGVALLLFLLGLEMNLRELPSIGKVALLTGIGQITFTSLIGFLIASALGFGLLPAIYIAIALTFSSTIIMVKLLSEKKDLGSLYGRIAVGFLLVQDFVAIAILMLLSGLGNEGLTGISFIAIALKATVLFSLVWVLSKKVLPNLFERFVASSPELLFIVSIAWALGFASFVAGPLGFTLEIGGFLAGLALSNLSEHLQIAARTRPLRDFFLTIFFLLLGTKLLLGNLGAIVVPSLIFSSFVLIGNPLIVLIILGALGYKKRTSFLAGLTVAQISEFSFILMAMGLMLGHVTEGDVSVVILVGAITMTVSTYLILGAEKIYARVKGYLSLFEKDTTHEATLLEEIPLTQHVVLIGCGRTGSHIISYFKKKKWPFLVVDFNPKVFNRLVAEGIPVLFGDIGDEDVAKLTQIDKAKMVISTTSQLADNLALLEHVRGIKSRPVTIMTARTVDESIKYYEKGADYVLLPQAIAGEHLRHLLSAYGTSGEKFSKIGKSHFNRLILK